MFCTEVKRLQLLVHVANINFRLPKTKVHGIRIIRFRATTLNIRAGLLLPTLSLRCRTTANLFLENLYGLVSIIWANQLLIMRELLQEAPILELLIWQD